MKNRKEILIRIAEKKFKRKLRSREKKAQLRKRSHTQVVSKIALMQKNESVSFVFNKHLSINLKYLLGCEKSDFFYDKIFKRIPDNFNDFYVPKQFCIIDNTKESIEYIKRVLGLLLSHNSKELIIDYTKCEILGLGAQALLDIILLEVIRFYKECGRYNSTKPIIKKIGGICNTGTDIEKLLYSVGTPAIHFNKSVSYCDIVKTPLCIHNSNENGNPITIREQKDLDTTKLVDYVLNCLKKINKTLAPDKLDDLCIVIGEILINAEEHSTTKHRYSIGYFQEHNTNGIHFGLFKLIILNFGETIYDKFKNPNCPNKDIVEKMAALSDQYTQKSFFFSRSFEEETLWTLYALQEGVSSIAPDRYIKRGNGSIQFIDSFFNIKGSNLIIDDFSKMTILSGNTDITFTGAYNITKKIIDGEEFKYMTFNKTGDIEDKPDINFVKFTDCYFPGTLISARILFNDDDLI